MNTWTPENRNAELPEINILNPNDEAGKVSSYLIEDGSYIRLKQLELGYTLRNKRFRNWTPAMSCLFECGKLIDIDKV